MTLHSGHHFTQVPGPTNIPERVLNAMNRQAVDFNRPDFLAMLEGIYPEMMTLFRLESGQVFIYAANGHGGWEAAISNLLAPGDRVLVPETGQFGRGWAEAAKALGVEVEFLEGDWRRAPDPQALSARLEQDREHAIKAVLLVQVDTASSVTSDVPAFRKAMDAVGHPALLMVDAIAALGAVDMQQSDWGVDVTVAASQKALMLPPGLAFVAVGDKALEAARANPRERYYWDWDRRLEREHYRWFCGTPSISMMFGLREVLDMIAEEGLDAAQRRHARLAEAVRRAVAAWAEGGALAFNVLKPGERADTVTTIAVPEAIGGETIRRYCREHFEVSLGGGLARLAKTTFRIGHMGYLNPPMVLGTLGALEASLKALDIPCGAGGLGTATDWLAETAPSSD
jgi:alanine-glyoxylate transaminase/serine-glyoxylate transaminase/serine-pyruvate transaminase